MTFLTDEDAEILAQVVPEDDMYEMYYQANRRDAEAMAAMSRLSAEFGTARLHETRAYQGIDRWGEEIGPLNLFFNVY